MSPDYILVVQYLATQTDTDSGLATKSSLGIICNQPRSNSFVIMLY